jgi:hypothetical protein
MSCSSMGSATTISMHGSKRTNLASTFWPRWLADEFPEIQVWVLRYGAPKFWFKPAALALPDRAKSVLGCLVDNELGGRDLLRRA